MTSRETSCLSQWSAATRVLSPVSATRVDGPSWLVTGFHYPSTRPVNSGRQLG